MAGWSGRGVLGDERLFGQFFCAKFYEKFDNSGAKWQGGREVSVRCVRGGGQQESSVEAERGLRGG